MISRSPSRITCSSPNPATSASTSVGVAAAEDRVEEDPVRLPVQLAYGLEVGFSVRVGRAVRA